MAFALMSEPSHQAIIDDSWISLQRALGCADSSSGEDTVVQMVEFAEQNNTDLFGGVRQMGIKVSAEAAVLILDLLIKGRDKFNEVALNRGFQILALFPDVWDPKGTFPQVLMGIALDAAKALLKFRSSTPSGTMWLNAADEFHSLALFLSENSHHKVASACAQSSVNLTAPLEAEKQVPPAKTALAIALKESDENTIAGSAFRYAQILINRAAKDSNQQLQAYDAVEFAIRNLPADIQIRSNLLNYLDYVTQKNQYLQPLGVLFWTKLESHERKQFPGIGGQEFQSLAVVNEQITSMTTNDWFKALDETSAWISHVENHRLGLDHSKRSLFASALWESWTFEHPFLMRAIPHGTSILRQPRLDDFLLTLSHEITHVFSMAGTLGLATTAMRWALFELEIELWSLSFKRPGFSVDEVPKHLVNDSLSPYAWWTLASDELAVHRLARLEQLLELARKIQIVEDAWSPWFEGLAIFGESADPRLDKEAYSPVASVVSQLQDVFLPKLAQEESKSILQVATEKQLKAEQLYSKAVQEAGKSRLLLHLEKYYDRYLAGYLAVRSVVAAWRQKLTINLSGAEAFRVLLHATRRSAFIDLLPDISTDISEFEAAVYEKQHRWVLSLLNISSTDLKAVLSIAQNATTLLAGRWEAGRFITHVPENAGEIIAVELHRIASEALDFRWQKSPELRVPDAEEDCAALMHAVNQSLRPLQPQLFAEDRVYWALAGNLIMPIGKVNCPFWLLRQDQTLECLIRTMERNASGAPSYDLIAFPINEEQFSALEKELLSARFGRMTVTRVADLSDFDRTIGRNYVVFQFGQWTHIQPRGLGFGSDDVNDFLKNQVMARLNPHPMKVAMQKFTDLRGLAGRAKTFLQSFDPLVKAAGLEIEVHPWLDRIESLAVAVDTRVIGKPSEIVAVNCASLATTSDATAQLLQKNGFNALRSHSAEAVENFINFLFDSGHYPVEDLESTVRESAVSILGIRLTHQQFGWDLAFPGSPN